MSDVKMSNKRFLVVIQRVETCRVEVDAPTDLRAIEIARSIARDSYSRPERTHWHTEVCSPMPVLPEARHRYVRDNWWCMGRKEREDAMRDAHADRLALLRLLGEKP